MVRVTKQDPVSTIKRSTLVFNSIQHMMVQPASSSEQELVGLCKSSFTDPKLAADWKESSPHRTDGGGYICFPFFSKTLLAAASHAPHSYF